MKKFITLAVSALTCLSMLAFTACEETGTQTPNPNPDPTPETQTHEHTWATEWTKDNDNHWHVCTGEDCEETSDKVAHTWNTGEVTTSPSALGAGVKTYTCTACSQTKTESVPYEPTEAQIWADAFNAAYMTNFTATLVDRDGTTEYKFTVVDGAKTMYFMYSEEERYMQKSADGVYTVYEKDGDNWEKTELPENQLPDNQKRVFEWYFTYAMICPDFGAFFNKFDDYDEQSETYVFEGIEDEDEIETNSILEMMRHTYYRASVKIENGKLKQVQVYMSGQIVEGVTHTITFSDYNTTQITLPTVE